MPWSRVFTCAGCVIAVLAVLVNVGRSESSAMPLPIKVVGTRILNSRDEPVRLRSVNCAGLEWTSDGQGHIVESVRVAIDDWHVNLIRLPLSQDRWFGKAPEQNDEGRNYRALVDDIVKLCASRGVYIMLELHWSNAGVWGEQIGQHSMPDEHSLAGNGTADYYNAGATGVVYDALPLFGAAARDPNALDPNEADVFTVAVTGAALGDFAGASYSLDRMT